eukprot:gene19789-39286_t
MAGSAVRERLSQEHWRVMVRAEEELTSSCAAQARSGDYPVQAALHILKNCSDHMAAITGAQTDRMTRDDGWRLLSIGRHVERLHFLASALARSFETGAVDTDGGFEALLTLFDSTITFHAQYQQRRAIAALTDLLVLDRDNPRSLGWVAHTLRGRLAKLAQSPAGEMSSMSLQVPNPDTWDLAHLCETPEGEPSAPALRNLLDALSECAFTVSEDISTTYFTHSGHTKHSPAVETAQHVAYLQPLQHAGQNLLSHALTISPQPAQQRNTLDVYGNTRCFFSLQVPHPVLEVQAMSIVSTSAHARPESAQPWEQLRDRLRYQAHTPFEAASEFVF